MPFQYTWPSSHTSSNKVTMPPPVERLKKELGLFDVYSICTGAMFSSGFFLLPGLAAAQTGPSVFLAYFLAGILMLPAMFSMAELATAMPRAGGDYFFLDRALGPVFGTIGGMGSYLALTLKSAFALVGMGAYLALYVEVPIKPMAIALTVAFVAINIFGAKETTTLQRILVTLLVSVMALFIIQGIQTVMMEGVVEGGVKARLTPFMPFGLEGLLGSVGFVFVSYAGLTKIASVAEEVKNPARNIPLGMMLSIISTSIIYVIGVFIMIAVLPPESLRDDLTPVATAGKEVMLWMPPALGLFLIVAAATAAFASTGNAGVMAASRYPLAMARDRLISPVFARIGRYKTPTIAILLTGGLMVVAIAFLTESGIAKLASAFQLLVFMLVNVTVIVMRESRIEFYDPAYRSPLYPWMQLLGILASALLITYLGHAAITMTLVVSALAVVWYYKYAHRKVIRQGAIYSWFEHLGRQRHEGVEHELEEILREQELRHSDPFEQIIASAPVIDIKEPMPLNQISLLAVQAFNKVCEIDIEQHTELFLQGLNSTYKLVKNGVALPHLRLDGLDGSHLVLVRYRQGYPLDVDHEPGSTEEVYAFFFLISPTDNPGQHLRVLAHIARQINTPTFIEKWRQANDELELREILIHAEGVLILWVHAGSKTQELLDRPLREIKLPAAALLAVITRDDRVIVPRGDTYLRENDRLTVIGDPDSIRELYRRYIADGEA